MVLSHLHLNFKGKSPIVYIKGESQTWKLQESLIISVLKVASVKSKPLHNTLYRQSKISAAMWDFGYNLIIFPF